MITIKFFDKSISERGTTLINSSDKGVTVNNFLQQYVHEQQIIDIIVPLPWVPPLIVDDLLTTVKTTASNPSLFW